MRKFVTVSRRNASHKFVDLYIRSVQSLRFIVVRPGPGNQFPLNRATELRVPIVQIPAAEGWDARRTDENFQLDTDAVSKLKPLALCFVQTQIRCVSISAVARALQHYRSKESRKFLFERIGCTMKEKLSRYDGSVSLWGSFDLVSWNMRNWSRRVCKCCKLC